ncbi:hypothetical protein PAXRUDRAFT_831751 [Paxillus rubicundulus Ve08.2h10]|uniref:Aminoglycoside phosphotransferase domain-containing protein n=1 Tax=Paxillus rubicundulus Ve08.2h10 TaxID=930991 RepID=A0A0D0E0N7_9AGAM|nr:hypothetical protein PAXRUDRAFT_831751 [Paxillus rubicundulus Ve08.2h10]
MSHLPNAGFPPDFFQNSLAVSPTVTPLALYPHFDPPLTPWRPSSYPRWFCSVFRPGDTPSRSPFDFEGEKPQCYSLHATAIEMESPLFSPGELPDLVHAHKQPSDPDWLRVYKISPDTIVKEHLSLDEAITEALNLSMIGTMTTIPVPKLRQIARHRKGSYLIMEYIEGETLDTAWSRLTLFAKLHIAWTLRGYVRQLRRLRRTVPGTLNGAPSIGCLFTEYGAGPFASYHDFTAWYNHKLDVSQRMKKAPIDAPRFDTSWPVVFTHMDLCPRNILLARDGTLYVLDWQRSGFYPAWFEYIAMLSDVHFKSPLWDLLTPWISHTVFSPTRKRILEYSRNIGWALTMGPLM